MKRTVSLLFFIVCILAGERQGGAAVPHFTLWQLPAQTPRQMMSYVLRTVNGRLIVIDGGTEGDAPYLRGFLDALGAEVEAWFITHPHDDHCGALTQILKKPDGLKIKAVYGSTPDEAWMVGYAPEPDRAMWRTYVQTLKSGRVPAVELKLGQEMLIDGVRIEVLAVKNPEIVNGFGLNNQCVVLRVSDESKTVLFLADLSPAAGDKLLHGPYASRLRADIVQMAHHGQNGARRDVYAAIRPTVCLWPAPRWLWENDKGQGPGTGPFQTPSVRRWMDELGVKTHKVMVDGLARID